MFMFMTTFITSVVVIPPSVGSDSVISLTSVVVITSAISAINDGQQSVLLVALVGFARVVASVTEILVIEISVVEISVAPATVVVATTIFVIPPIGCSSFIAFAFVGSRVVF